MNETAREMRQCRQEWLSGPESDVDADICEDEEGFRSTVEHVQALAEELLRELGHEEEDSDGDEELESCKVKIQTQIGQLDALLDTGAYSTWVREDLYRQITGCEPKAELPGAARIEAADGRPIQCVVGHGRLEITLWGRAIKVEVRIMRDLPSGIIFGRRFLQRQGIVLDFANMRGSYGQRSLGARAGAGRIYRPDDTETLTEISMLSVRDRDVEKEIRELDLSGAGQHGEELRAVLLKYCDVFKGLGRVDDREFTIDLEETGNTPLDLDVPARRLSTLEREVERREITKMLEAGVLEKSKATASTVNVFVEKKTKGADGNPEMRTTSDMRKLNAVTRTLKYPLPNIAAITEWLASKSVFTGLDLTSGYWSVPLHPKSRALTAVKTVLGVLQYTRMVMGLKNAAAFLQQMMDSVLAEFNWTIAVAYQDDVSIGSVSMEEHVEHVDKVLSRLRNAGMKVKLAKCQFAKCEVNVLGFKVKHAGISPSDAHVKTLASLPEPEDAQSLLRFLGILLFLGRFVERLSERSAPLYEVLKNSGWNKKKKKRQVVRIHDFNERWGQAQRDSFLDLRDSMAGPNVLTAPRQGERKRLVTDASSVGYGAVLLQWEGKENPPDAGDGEVNDGWRPVLFLSRGLKGGEPRWNTTERECGAVVWALGKLRVYLQGEEFEVVTDHQALLWLMALEDPRPRLARWVMKVQDYSYKIVHVPGRSAVKAAPDSLSRDFIDMASVQTCRRCKEVLEGLSAPERINELPENEEVARETSKPGLLQRIRRSQEEEFGQSSAELEKAAKRNRWLLTEEALLAKVHMGVVRIVVPKDMQREVVKTIHEARVRGHWGVSRTAAVVAGRFWWAGWLSMVQQVVRECDLCARAQRTPPARKGPMRVHAPTRRNQIAATGMDVLTISPASEGRSKVLVMGELLSRFVIAADIPDEKASTIAQVMLDRYIAVFGPPETMITDGGLQSEVVTEVCRLVGTEAVTTLPHHPHGNGFVERYNRTLLQDLRKLTDSQGLESWRSLLSLSVLRYNTTEHRITGMTPFRGMFGTDVLPMEFEVTEADTDRKEGDEHELGQRMRAIEILLHARTKTDRRRVKVWYDRQLADAEEYAAGERVFVYFPQDETAQGRKLTQAWRPMKVVGVAGVNAYMLEDQGGGRTRAHVDRMRRRPQEQTRGETWDRLSPESAALRAKVIGKREVDGRKEWKMRSRGRRGYVWKEEKDLPEALVGNLHRTYRQ